MFLRESPIVNMFYDMGDICEALSKITTAIQGLQIFFYGSEEESESVYVKQSSHDK